MLNVTFKNSQDIDNFFKDKTGKSFIDYYNDKHAGRGSFAEQNHQHSVPTINDKSVNNWQRVWNSIESLFGKSEINLAEFLSINTSISMETGSKFTPNAEGVGRKGTPGLSYAYNPIKNLKGSYNAGSKATELGNKTAFKLFNDTDYKNAHGQKPFGNILKDTTDNRWDTDQFPFGFSGNDVDKETDRSGKRSGFLFESDFMKFRGRGFIQTTGRANYKDIIKFILSYDGRQSVILKYKNKWQSYGTNYDRVANVSSNDDWDELFNDSDLIIPNVAVNIHAKKSGKATGQPSSPYNIIDTSKFSDDKIRDMDRINALRFWDKYKIILKAHCELKEGQDD